MSARAPLTTSVKLCGGMCVAIPTAIPFAPFMRRFGATEGNTTGSWVESSKFGMKSTVSFSISSRSLSANSVMRHSV